MPYSLRNYPQQLQCKRNWCWAAMIVSLVHYVDRSSTLTQSQLVEELLGTPSCCSGADAATCGTYLNCLLGPMPPTWCSGPGICDQAIPDDVRMLDHLATKYGIPYRKADVPQLSLQQIEEQLRNNWPVFVVRADGSGAEHVLVITGIDGDRLTVVDSQGDCKQPAFENLMQPITAHGGYLIYLWTRTYHHV